MGAVPSQPSSYIANTKAKAAEMNAKLTALYNSTGGGTGRNYASEYTNTRLTNTDVTLTGSDCMFVGYYQIDTATTIDLATSTARMIVFSELELKTGTTSGTLHVAPNAEVHVVT